MTGHAIALGPCWACGTVFAFNPERVPSISIDGRGQPCLEGQGTKRPLCRDCVNQANQERATLGLDPIPILPGAYEGLEL